MTYSVSDNFEILVTVQLAIYSLIMAICICTASKCKKDCICKISKLLPFLLPEWKKNINLLYGSKVQCCTKQVLIQEARNLRLFQIINRLIFLTSNLIDHSSYWKIYAKYHFCCSLLYQYKLFKNDLNLIMSAQILWIRRVLKLVGPVRLAGLASSSRRSWLILRDKLL